MKLPDPKFWEGKRVFVTGAEGFKGTWLVQWLGKLGAIVETNETMDICDATAMKQIVAKFHPEIAILMAAMTTVQEAVEDPLETVRTNALGTVTLLEALKNIHGIRAILNVTTDKVYHIEGIDRGYSEFDPLGGLELYAVSKVCAEHICKVYQKTYKLPLVTARAGNVIGGGDWKVSRIIPNYYYAYIYGTTLQVNPDAVRPWQYVLDCLCGYLLLCERLYDNTAYVGAWNFASNEFESRSVQWIVDEMNKYFIPTVPYKLIDTRGYYETKNLKLCSDKARNILQWIPKYDMQETIKRTAAWYNHFIEGYSPEALNELEINAYMLGEGNA